MARVTLREDMKERPLGWRPDSEPKPFITISRQYGCHGFSLCLLLVEYLAEELGEHWDIFHKDILARLATETNVAQEMLEQQLRFKPSFVVEFFRSFSQEHIPSGYEIRNRITTIIRGLALQGHAIILGQGGAAATQDLPNGLSVRLEAPEEWRVYQVEAGEGLDAHEARQKIHDIEEQREYLRRFYELKFPRKPAFHLTYDASVFSLEQIAHHIVDMVKLKALVKAG